MEIKRVDIYKVDAGTLKAFASVNFDDEIVVKNIKVVDGRNGLFVSFPSEKGKDGEYHDTFYPLTKATRDYIEDEILTAYENAGKKASRKKR